MHPLHDNDLDRISREAAEHFEVDSGASGWADLEKRLDEELPQKKKKRRFLFWLFFITATTGGALTALLKYQPLTPLANNVPDVHAPAYTTATGQNNQATYNQKDQPAAPAPSRSTADQEPSASTAQSKTNKTGDRQPTAATNLASTPGKSSAQPIAKPGNVQKQKPTNAVGVDKAPLTLNYATIPPANAGKDKIRSKRTSRGKQGKQQNRTDHQKNLSVDPAPEKTGADTPVPTVDGSTTGEPVDADKGTVTPAAATDQQATTQPANKLPATAADSIKDPVQQPVKKQDRKKDNISQPLEIGLVAGPDMSAVSFGPLYKAGYVFGLQLGYRLSNRWSVNTGVLYTKKYYQADSQYFKYYSPWPNWKLDEVKGNCSMWEIPVNVRYDVAFNDKRRWFASTGLSTYLMDKENYTLYYNTPGGRYSRPQNTDSNSSYVFSIWNLSAGFERSLGRNFSIQAEPYLKVPLKGLGTGSMRMNSYGIFFTLKYKPGFQNRRSDNRK
ncbi:outer membrane beta-barrel protein [Longitalea luteola]|uniref:outer membrane beta-barrel protein n=1 Tax=Longitalea luteola TaxID=2812563 RepID=UPI001A97BBA4|nr:outer membrane beta-barrel protein [Longitalea luteola]